jgi:AAA domain-containing protein/DnaB helicase-like protein
MLNATDDLATGNTGDLFDAGGAQLTDHHAEEQFLGFLLNKPTAISDTVDLLQPVDLHDPMHRRIYEMLLRAHDTDTPITMEMLTTGLGNAAGKTIAQMMTSADLDEDVTDIADHLSTIAERRAVGTVEDDYVLGEKIISKFGGQRWEDIGTGTGTTGYAWLVEDIIPLGEITLAFGDSGSGKSFNMFDCGMSIARGLNWNGRNVEPGLVIYVAAEAGKGFAKRKIAYAIQNKLDPTDPLPFYLCTKRPDFFHSDDDAKALAEEIRQVRRMYRQKLVLIVADTLSALAPGMNENASQDVSMVRRRLVMLQEEFEDTAIVLVHHKPKGGSTPRGHGSLTGDFETTIEFETLPDRHRATVRKQREGKSGISWEFNLPVVEVGRNKWGNAETSCVVVPCGTAARKPSIGFHATPTELLLLRALYDAVADHGQPAPAGLPASITKVVEQRYVRERMRERYISPEEDSSAANGRFRTAFSRAAAKLRDGAVLGVQGNLLWPTGKSVNGFNGPMTET